MEIQLTWDTLVEASRYMFKGPSKREVFIFLVVLIITTVVILVPYLLSKISHQKEIEKAFFSRGRSIGLNDNEIQLLWKYARKLPYDPQMIYENKPLFEKVVTKIVHEDIGDLKAIPAIRTKLRFDTLPWFIPITTTRDIDLYQTGKLNVDNSYVDAAVWDKTETELHIVILGALPRPLKTGETVKFHFIREWEGRYNFESEIKKKYTESDRVVLVLEHVETLHRVQLRESIRWKVNIPVEFAVIENFNENIKPEYTEEGKIEDISTKGVRICSPNLTSAKEGRYIIMNFQIGSNKFQNVLGQIVTVKVMQTQTCIGVRFLKISRQEEKIIDRFIMDEQRRVIKAYKVGEVQ